MTLSCKIFSTYNNKKARHLPSNMNFISDKIYIFNASNNEKNTQKVESVPIGSAVGTPEANHNSGNGSDSIIPRESDQLMKDSDEDVEISLGSEDSYSDDSMDLESEDSFISQDEDDVDSEDEYIPPKSQKQVTFAGAEIISRDEEGVQTLNLKYVSPGLRLGMLCDLYNDGNITLDEFFVMKQKLNQGELSFELPKARTESEMRYAKRRR